jgi:cysteine-rich repeat protein
MRDTRRVLVALVLTCVFACGGGGGGGTDNPDAAVSPPDAPLPTYVCGNGEVEEGEECDDSNQEPDAVCTSTCQFSCGDGIVNYEEGCDIAIGSGEGACPSSCDDSDACTSDLLSGNDCNVTCVNAPITAHASGDGCCLPGSNNNEDSDCPTVCGNGQLEGDEACDTGIANGQGACPTGCNDNIACTRDQLVGTACATTCSNTAITQPANGDGCCPAGANSNVDDDCPRANDCGNGRVDNNETCDTAIGSGAGACPTSCNDSNACTLNQLQNGGTCTAVCVFPEITGPDPADQCCAPGENGNNEPDCPSVCGNRVTEPGEQCDDANTNPNDGCHECENVALPPTAFRFTELFLRDPHIRVGFVQNICLADVTDTPFAGFAVNPLIATAMMSDEDMDGLRDFSPVFVFRPLQQSQPTAQLQVGIGECTLATPGVCSFDPAPASVTATNASSGTCLAPLPNTTNDYSPAVGSATGPCFSSSAQTLSIVLADIPITLTDAQIGATYEGNPATGTINGLLRGFLSETQANAISLPADLPVVGGRPLSFVLPGGMGNCARAAESDKDVHNGVPGWWFYLNFRASAVPWQD